MAKRNTLRQKYYKVTGLHWKRFGKLEAKPTTEYCKWLENELLTEMEQVKKLNINDVSNFCPNCDSVDIEISKRCNECSAHCNHKSQKDNIPYLKWFEFADNEIANGREQTICPSCYKWLFPSEV